MGLISREATAPIQDGETASGAEVEAEFNKIFTEINGQLDNDNIVAAANINGSKLAATSIAGSKLQNSTVTTTQLAASAVPKGYVATDGTADAFTTSTAFVDVPNVTMATITAGSTDDIVMCDFDFSAEDDGSNNSGLWAFGFSVSTVATTAADSSDCAVWEDGLDIGALHYDFKGQCHVGYAVAAPAAAALYIKPRYRFVSGTADAQFGVTGSSGLRKIFRVLVVPTK